MLNLMASGISQCVKLTLSPPVPLGHYTLPYWSNPPFLIFAIRALWRSGLSAGVPDTGLDQFGASNLRTAAIWNSWRFEGVKLAACKFWRSFACRVSLHLRFRAPCGFTKWLLVVFRANLHAYRPHLQ